MTGGSSPEVSSATRGGADLGWTDQRLVGACLRGDEQAWSTLVDKYKNLVYSIAIKYGAPPDEAADLFQAVWVDVYKELGSLRKQGSVRSWIISVTRHKCYHWRQKRRREAIRSAAVPDLESDPRHAVDPVSLEELERDQLVREAIFTLPSRCRELIQLLFYSQPPMRYKEVARQLGLAVGSIGFIRGRCLKRLQRQPREAGSGLSATAAPAAPSRATAGTAAGVTSPISTRPSEHPIRLRGDESPASHRKTDEGTPSTTRPSARRPRPGTWCRRRFR